ncbi:MAG: hypothetical protein IJ570_06995 [Prevotella sp.]|nr:hypothetical protein [Prevotella sp.]
MRTNLLRNVVALTALFTLGTMNASAENLVGIAPVKMTYIDQSNPEVALGQLDTIRAGYNKAAAVGSAIAFGNTSWGENKIGVLKVDASPIPGTVQKATLKAKISGSSDSKRTTGWGIAQTDNEWAADLTYATAGSWTVSALLNGGTQVWTSTKSATVFEEHEWDITEALSGGDLTATLLVYETAAAGGYMTEAYVEVEYEEYEATTTKYDFEDENKVFTDDSRITGAIENDATLGSNVIGWTCANNAQNGYSFSHYDFSSLLNQPALVAVEFDYYNTAGGRAILNVGDALVRGTTGGSSKTTYNSTGVIFRIGSDKNNAFIQGQTLPQVDKENTVTTVDEETGEETSETTITPGFCNKWMHVSLIANIDAKTVAWTVTDLEGNVLNEGFGDFFAADANDCSQIDLFGYINNSHCAMLDNLTITNYKSNAVFAEYTIRYVNADGQEIKASRSGNGQVGKFVSLLDADKASVYAEDNSMKYLYDSDDSETVAIAEENTVITVTFRNADKYFAVLNCMVEGGSGAANRLAQFQDPNKYWFWEGDTYALYPARGYKHTDGAYYFTEATSWNGATFNFPGSLSPSKNGGKTYYIGTLYYSKVDSVAYYSDIERLALPTTDEGDGTGLGQLSGTVNSWYSFSGGYFDRFSGARGIRLDFGSYVWTEPIENAGTYKVTMYGRNDKSAAAVNPYNLGLLMEDGSVELYDIQPADWGSATTGSNIVEGVAIPAGGKLVIYNNSEENLVSLDDISLTMTGEYEEPVLTNINGVQVMSLQNGVIYNLNGQVVKNAQKGLYIKNGKKYIVK